MKPIHLTDFTKALQQAYAAYGREPNDQQLDAIFDALSVFDLAEVQRACRTAVRELKFPPNAADLTKIIRNSRELRGDRSSPDAIQCSFQNSGQRCPLRGVHPVDLSDPSGPRECELHHYAKKPEHKAEILDDLLRNRPEFVPDWRDAKVAQDLLRNKQPPESVAEQFSWKVVNFVQRHGQQYPDIRDFYLNKAPPPSLEKPAESTHKQAHPIGDHLDAAGF